MFFIYYAVLLGHPFFGTSAQFFCVGRAVLFVCGSRFLLNLLYKGAPPLVAFGSALFCFFSLLRPLFVEQVLFCQFLKTYWERIPKNSMRPEYSILFTLPFFLFASSARADYCTLQFFIFS